MYEGTIDRVVPYSTRERADIEVNVWIMDDMNSNYRNEDNEDWSDEEMIEEFLEDSAVRGSTVRQAELVI